MIPIRKLRPTAVALGVLVVLLGGTVCSARSADRTVEKYSFSVSYHDIGIANVLKFIDAAEKGRLAVVRFLGSRHDDTIAISIRETRAVSAALFHALGEPDHVARYRQGREWPHCGA